MNKKTKLYHCEKGFPKGIETQFRTGKFLFFDKDFTNHAKKAAKEDKYGEIVLPKAQDFTNLLPFEITVENGQIIKSCYRVPYNESYDLSMSISRPNNEIITVWLNDKNDTHNTLDLSNYDEP